MPAKTKPRTKAKRETIARAGTKVLDKNFSQAFLADISLTKAQVHQARKIRDAYGCAPAETDMDDFYYSRRNLAKLPNANKHGWHEQHIRMRQRPWLMISKERCRPSASVTASNISGKSQRI
jgi:hypothetical protein